MYEERIILFLDILGFSQLVKSSKNNISEIDKIKNAIKTIQDVFDINQTSKERVITQFSDSIVVSFHFSELGEVAFLLSKTNKLIKELIKQEIICRGAITKGKMIHDKEFMFGPAFIEAYQLEMKVANFPRIILVDESIINTGIEYFGYHPADHPSYEKSEIFSHIIKDIDGFYFVNYFNIDTVCEIIEEEKQYLYTLQNVILQGIESNIKNPSIRQKYEWMRSKYNNLVRELKKDKRVSAGGLEYGSDKTSSFYKELT